MSALLRLRLCRCVPVRDHPDLCNLRHRFGVYKGSWCALRNRTGTRRVGAAWRRRGRNGMGQEEEEMMVYRPFSYLSATSSSTFQLGRHQSGAMVACECCC